MKSFLISMGRVWRTGLQNLTRNLWLTSAATLVMVVTLSTVLGTYAANLTFSRTIATVTDKIDISIYLKDDVKKERRDQLQTELAHVDNVKSVEFVSKDQALKDFLDKYKDKPDVANSITQIETNPLPASFRIKPQDPNKLDPISEFINRDDIKKLQSDKPSYSGERKNAIDKIVKAANFIKIAGIVASVVFGVISILIIFNTIRMAIFNRKDEIEIMKLIGAKKWYIRGPFLVEAALYGMFAAVLSTVLTTLMLSLQGVRLKYYLEDIDTEYTKQVFTDHRLLILVIMMTLGVLIGIISSSLATRKYLRMKTGSRWRRSA